MRVLHIGKFFPPHPGGIERFSADLCTTLAAHECDVVMLAHAEPHAPTKFFDAEGVAVTLTACHGQWLYAPISPSFPFALARLIREFKPDLLHLHLPNTSAFWALMLPAARRLPWIVHWHSDIPLDVRRPAVRVMYRLYRPFEQALLRRAHAVVATSAAYRDASVALAPWHAKITIVPLGLDAAVNPSGTASPTESATLAPAHDDSFSTNILWPSAGLRVLAVGRLSYYKGFDVLLRALAQTPEASLLLVGDGECDAQLRNLVDELGVAARARFAGRVDDATLALAYAQAQVFCLPSIERTEAFGMVLLEAMRAGLPVIASNIKGSGVGYVVENEKTGLLVAPGDAAALSAALRRLAPDDALRQRLGEAGRTRWRNEFTLTRCAEQIVALYRAQTTAHRAEAAQAD